jgi:hypothetical protein
MQIIMLNLLLHKDLNTMRKFGTLLFFSFLLIFSNSSAQITITTADIASPGKVTYQATDTMPVISVGPAGTNQIWSFAGILNQHTLDTLIYTPVVDAENYMDFPTANLIIPINKNADIFYVVNDVAKLSILASTQNKILFPGGDKTTIVFTNTPAEKMIEFPSTFGTYFTDSHRSFTQYFYGSVPPNTVLCPNQTKRCGLSDSLREKMSFDKTVLVDAWGTITTQAGTFDAIRLKETKISHDTIEAHDALLYAWFLYKVKADSTVTYTWYANNVGVPIATATMDSLGAVKHVTWITAAPGTVGINDIAQNTDVTIFPNPTQNEITFSIDASKISSVNIYDISGRLIGSFLTSTNLVTINTSAYTNGMYSYSLLDKKNNTISRGKFSVIR